MVDMASRPGGQTPGRLAALLIPAGLQSTQRGRHVRRERAIISSPEAGPQLPDS